MKNILNVICLIIIKIVLLTNQAEAQTKDTIDGTKFDFLSSPTPKAGSIIAFTKYKKFAGTWIAKTKDVELNLLLEIYNAPFGNREKPNFFTQTLVGGIKYSNNNTVLINTLSEKNIIAKMDQNENDNELVLLLTYGQKMRQHPFTVKLLDKNTMIILPNYTTGEGIKKDPKLFSLCTLQAPKLLINIRRINKY